MPERAIRFQDMIQTLAALGAALIFYVCTNNCSTRFPNIMLATVQTALNLDSRNDATSATGSA